VYNWRIPKKRYLKTGKICGFSQNLSFGVFVGNACFLWQTGEFSKKKKKKKTGDDLYKSLIILLYSWLHTRNIYIFGKILLFFSHLWRLKTFEST
jgi:hypothetical protein